jgi:hypothetical protein
MPEPDDDETPAESAAHDHGVPLTESQRATRESLADVLEDDEDDEG